MAKISNIQIDNAYWSDEFDYEGVAQVQKRSVTGALLVFEQAQPTGQPLTLQGAWVTRQALLQLQTLRRQVSELVVVELEDGRKFNALFNRSEKSIESKLVRGAAALPNDDDLYEVVLRFLIVSQIS